ncbi:Ubiquitin-associated domain-containing family protein [Rhynchospora pubera]|uniref:Ubiquitin-associated domain-containing family protein n=1 Tax=Rhynchospora pubera TaxID=906938 RepID=A0AAV8ESV5_9POAL|nr:Ubiquitin-associated domain-containing family protein [Rhynchospora pubera]
MQGGGLSGFQNAPVTRALIIASGFLTVALGARGKSRLLGLSYQDLTKNPRVWRIIASGLAFSSTPELLFGLYLLYYFRLFERQIGSNKFSVFILFSGAVSSALEVIALMLLKDSKFSVLASGPYSLIFALFVPFYFDIPITSRFRILGINFSDKSFIYLAGLQLLLSSWRRSLVPGICGLIAASLYRLNVFGIRRLKIPGAIASFFSRYFASSSPGPSGPLRRNIAGNIASNMGRQTQRNYRPATVVPPPEPPAASLETLVSMGFDENAARQALTQARNDINVATNILLEAQSH